MGSCLSRQLWERMVPDHIRGCFWVRESPGNSPDVTPASAERRAGAHSLSRLVEPWQIVQPLQDRTGPVASLRQALKPGNNDGADEKVLNVLQPSSPPRAGIYSTAWHWPENSLSSWPGRRAEVLSAPSGTNGSPHEAGMTARGCGGPVPFPAALEMSRPRIKSGVTDCIFRNAIPPAVTPAAAERRAGAHSLSRLVEPWQIVQPLQDQMRPGSC
ncbi:hypothetical protein SAMN06265374_2986 [Roseibium denhamense]|uniref:Uncharacterized protein n=1 Tax=Roseibium denhamense TaxID=76305 RepID=A0ABY1PAF1_9HYPH|nr:hypothetical protein SAMN06265374_2986 [Roseibium denhamense]